MSSGLHVVHVTLALDLGGLERVVLNLVAQGIARGQRVTVLCVERPGNLAADVAALGAAVVCADKGRGLKLSAVARVRTLLKQLKPDVVHTHQMGALFYAGLAARWGGRPVVVHTEHGKHYDAGGGQSRRLACIASTFAGRFFCVSEDIAEGVVAAGVVSPAKVVVVPNGIETGRFARLHDANEVRRSLGIPESAPVVGTVGNLREVKRQDVLIRGFARLGGVQGRGMPHLLIVGDGELRGDLLALAKNLGIANRVHFVGRQTKPEQFLHAMDVFALTSRSEGMPLAVLEAWAAGLPVVASAVGGLPALIEEGVNGKLIPSGDDAVLAERLAELLVAPAAAREMGRRGQERVRARYDVSAMAAEYERHYFELLTQRRGAGCGTPVVTTAQTAVAQGVSR
jgi:glycosyltransferase involved in cell wall biosynthesis